MVIRVLVATGVRAYREGLQRVLQGAEGIALAGIASTAEQAVEQACKLLPSVILLDIGMAKSLALAGQMVGIPRVCGFVMLGKPEAYADVVVCLPAEVVAFVARDATVADLLSAIRAAGGVDVAMRVVAPPPTGPSRGTGHDWLPATAPLLRHCTSHRTRDGNPQAHPAGIAQQDHLAPARHRAVDGEESRAQHSRQTRRAQSRRSHLAAVSLRKHRARGAWRHGRAETDAILPLEQQPAVA